MIGAGDPLAAQAGADCFRIEPQGRFQPAESLPELPKDPVPLRMAGWNRPYATGRVPRRPCQDTPRMGGPPKKP